MFLKEADEYRLILLAYLAQHPTDGLLHQVVRRVEERGSQGKDVGEIAVFDERHRGHNGNALVPQQRVGGQAAEHVAWLVLQVFAHDIGSREIHQIPVVDAGRLCQVEVENGFPPRFIALLETLHQHQQGTESAFVPRALKQLGSHFGRFVLMTLRHEARIGYHNAQKAVAFAILSPPRLEKLGQVFALHRVDVGLQFGLYFLGLAHLTVSN